MPQESIKPMDTAGTVRKGGKVRPQEPVEIFASHENGGQHLGEPGTKHVVHAVLAHKLISKGAAFLSEKDALDAAGKAPKAEAKKSKKGDFDE